MGRTKRPEMSGDQKEMDRLCGLKKTEFSAEMINQYGDVAFNKGYELLSKNKMLMLEDAGPAKLDDQLSTVISDKKARETFIKICG
jgi:hypothetical protein